MKILLVVLGVFGWILAFFLFVICLFLFLPLRVKAAYYDNVLSLWAGAGPVTLKILPLKKKVRTKTPQKAAQPKKSEEKAPPSKPKKVKNPAKEKEPFQISFSFIKECIIKCKDPALNAIKGFKINKLKAHYVISNDDPSKAALLYGRLAAGLPIVLQLLENNINWRNTDIFIEVDFEGKGKIDGEIKVQIVPFRVLIAGLKILFAILKLKKSSIKERKPANEQCK